VRQLEAARRAAKDTVCSPTTSPDRSDITPISLPGALARQPRAPVDADLLEVAPSASATTSAMWTAVPLGASFL